MWPQEKHHKYQKKNARAVAHQGSRSNQSYPFAVASTHSAHRNLHRHLHVKTKKIWVYERRSERVCKNSTTNGKSVKQTKQTSSKLTSSTNFFMTSNLTLSNNLCMKCCCDTPPDQTCICIYLHLHLSAAAPVPVPTPTPTCIWRSYESHSRELSLPPSLPPPSRARARAWALAPALLPRDRDRTAAARTRGEENEDCS